MNIQGWKIGCFQSQGTDRRQLEDRLRVFMTRSRLLSFVVCDGHAGHETAEAVRNEFPAFLKKELENGHANSLESLRQAFLELGKVFSEHPAGACAIAGILSQDSLFWANVGDCAVFLINNLGPIMRINPLHDLRNPSEVVRLKRCDATPVILDRYLLSGDHLLNVTRAFGDRDFKPWVIAEPEVGTRFWPESGFALVVATDGVHKRVSLAKIGSIVRSCNSDVNLAARSLAEQADENGSTDDMSVLVIRRA